MNPKFRAAVRAVMTPLRAVTEHVFAELTSSYVGQWAATVKRAFKADCMVGRLSPVGTAPVQSSTSATLPSGSYQSRVE